MENSTCTFCKCVESWFQYRKCSSERTAFNEWILYGIHKSMTFIHQLFTHSFSQIQIWFGMFVSTLFVHKPNEICSTNNIIIHSMYYESSKWICLWIIWMFLFSYEELSNEAHNTFAAIFLTSVRFYYLREKIWGSAVS